MTKYEQLLQFAADHNISVKEIPMVAHDGLYMNNRIAINSDLKTDAERACVMAEELAHHYTAVGDITGTSALAIKQEIIGRRTAHEILAPVNDIITAIAENYCRSKHEIAETLEITEDFLEEALQHYKSKYGLYIIRGNRMLWFDPLGLLDMYEPM